MNELKKIIYLQGTLLTPLTIGSAVYISHGGQVIRTSRVVAIGEATSRHISFETLNSHYCVAFVPTPISAAMPAYSRCAA